MTGLANVGDVLAGKYRVDKILGIGGMGMVVQAMHLDLDQKVALKFMLPASLESPEASARFLREARAAGRLTGEHVCRVIDVGRFESGAPYIVMEYLEGYDLGTLLKRRGPLPISEAVDYILQACEGMAEAHALGIVHRDLKPDNLFLATRVDGDRRLKVLDFGISKAAVTGLATKTGDILGSPAYMAPEQMKATKDVDPRADIWSLGVVLHQLLCGKLPFTGDTLPSLCLAVMNEPAPHLSELRQDVPPPLGDAIAKCLAKQRDERHVDVSDLAAAIAPFGPSSAIGAVTRVRSLLRGRATPTTLPPTHDELGDFHEVAPTLAHTSGAIAPIIPTTPATPLMRRGGPGPAPRLAGTTTLASSAGESIALPRSRLPLGVVGAIAGAAVLIVLIAVMAMRGGDEPRAAGEPLAPSATPPSAVTTEPIAAPSPPPSPPDPAPPVTPPPVEPATGTPAADDAHATNDGGRSSRKRPARDAKASPDGGSPASPVDGGAGTADEDEWGRMLHDHPETR